MSLLRCTAAIVVAISLGNLAVAADLRDEALATARQATRFLVEEVSTRGGYLWAYSTDLRLREGEGVVTTETVWVQPPGTPAVGAAFVRLYRASGDKVFLEAALAAAEALRQGQMRSGGWQDRVEFEPEHRRKWAYRLDAPTRREKDQSSLDDDKTQSALRFLIRLDQALNFENEVVHEMTQYGLDGLLTKGQFSGGGFPQVWMGKRDDEVWDTPLVQASVPQSWPREYPGHNQYWNRYTLNDHLARDVMEVLLLAEDVYGDARYRQAALRLADSLLAAQMPAPQPAWAQQYNASMHPIWARRFEPPAITTSESFGVIGTLLQVYRRTADRKYLEPIPKALEYLASCELPDGQVARFYELETDRPLYFDRDYHLTYDDGELPTHYGFKLDSQVDALREQYRRHSRTAPEDLRRSAARQSRPSDRYIAELIESTDRRGIWVSDGGMKYHQWSGPTIKMRVVVEHLHSLADYLQATSPTTDR